jgi:hypothetical protein
MTIYVYKQGTFRPVTRVYKAMSNNVASIKPREVLLVQVAENDPGQKSPKLVTYHDRYQKPVTDLRGLNATHGSAEIAWTAPEHATDYQVLMATKKLPATTFGAKEIKPSPTEWIKDNSYKVNGLQPNCEYLFQVRAKRTAANGDPIINLVDSNAITLATGHPAETRKNPSYDADPAGYPTGKPDLVYINAARTDTWTLDYRWGSGSRGPDVIQGYASDSSRNGYGGIYYGTARAQLRTALANAATSGGLLPDEVDILLDQVQLTDAKIDLIVRRGYGGGTPTIHIYPSKLNFSSTARPVAAGGTAAGTTFTAPAVTSGHNTKDDLVLASSRLLTWAREWVEPAPSHNGMLIYNTTASGNATYGRNGYCVFRSCLASSTTATAAEWRLKLWAKWNYSFSDAPPRWL